MFMIILTNEEKEKFDLIFFFNIQEMDFQIKCERKLKWSMIASWLLAKIK